MGNSRCRILDLNVFNRLQCKSVKTSDDCSQTLVQPFCTQITITTFRMAFDKVCHAVNNYET